MRIPAKGPFAYFRWRENGYAIMSTGNTDSMPRMSALCAHAATIFGPPLTKTGTRTVGRTKGFAALKIGFGETVAEWPVKPEDEAKLTELHRWWSDNWGD